MSEFHRLPPPGTDPAHPLVGTWRYESATCDVSALPEGGYYLSALESTHEGLGHGRGILTLIERAADAQGEALCLVSDQEMAPWYVQRGFRPTAQHDGLTMLVRMPQVERPGGSPFMHADRDCPVCFPKALAPWMAAVPAPPMRNPEMGGHTWFHGTHFDPDQDQGHARAEEFGHHSPDPGGYLEHPEGREPEEEAESHWNTSLGVHFTGLHHVAESFANGKGGAWGTTPSRDSRVAHAHLHMSNPKDYADETEMARHAIKIAHGDDPLSRGHRYFDEHEHEPGGPADRFAKGEQPHEDGDYDSHSEDLERAQSNLSPEGRKAVVDIDRHGVQPHHTLHEMDSYLAQHPHRASVLWKYQNHLAEHGHDGITYGNEYEGPKGHRCAIAMDPKQIHVRKWNWLHPDQQHLNEHPDHGDHNYAQRTIGDFVHADGRPKTAGRPRPKPRPLQQPVHPFTEHPDDSAQCVECNFPEVNRHHVSDVDFQPRLPGTLSATDHDVLYHLTDKHHFGLDPEHAPHDNTFAIEDRSGRKGAYLTDDPDHWRARGYHRPYVAEVHVPKGLARQERWGGEKFLPAEHFDKAKVNRVMPFDQHQRERWGGRGTVEEYHGTPASTGDKDVRDFTPQEHTEHLHRLRDYLHDVQGYGHNEFNEAGEHVGTDEEDHEGMPVRRDRDGNVMTRDRYASKTARVLTDWAPTERLFSPTKQTLDPRLFSDKKMLPEVRSVLMQKMDGFMSRHGGKDWTSWARMYLAGSEASLWWGNNDFDILVGVNYDAFRKATGSTLRDEEITDSFNRAFRVDWNNEDWHPPFRPDETWHLTGYVNPASYDIRAIKPYAAYEVVSDTWFVEPISEPTGHKFDDSQWYYMEGFAERIRAAMELREPSRTNALSRIWTFLHRDRSRAFGPNGTGAFDRGNATEKYLDQAGLWDVLVQGRFGKTAGAGTYTHSHMLNQATPFHGARYGDQIDPPSPEQASNGSDLENNRFEHRYSRSGTPVAKLQYEIGSREPDTIHVMGLSTHPAHRGAGLASALMDQMQEHAEKHGMTIDHGQRTPHGRRWWNSYSTGATFKPHLHQRPDDHYEGLGAPNEIEDSHSNYFGQGRFDDDEWERGKTAAVTWGDDQPWDHYYDNEPKPHQALKHWLDGRFSQAFTAEGFDHSEPREHVLHRHGMLPSEGLRSHGALHDVAQPQLSRDYYNTRDRDQSDAMFEEHKQHLNHFEQQVRQQDPEGTKGLEDHELRGHWESHMRRSIGRGDISLPEAERKGFHGDDRETGRVEGDWAATRGSEGPRRGGYKPLPHDLHHVTTNAEGVLASGLKTRREQGMGHGMGLGGGSDDHISVTSDHGLATDIYHSLHEYHAFLNGKISHDDLFNVHHGGADPAQLRKSTEQGVGTERIAQMHRGMTSGARHYNYPVEPKDDSPGAFMSHSEVHATHGPDWQVKPGHESLGKNRNGEDTYTSHAWERPATDEEKVEHRSQVYKTFSSNRGWNGGHRDPLFMSNDPAKFSKANPDNFAVMHLHPSNPKASGYPLRGDGEHEQGADSGEWRVPTGDALKVHGYSKPQPRHEQEQAQHDEKHFERTAASVYGGALDWMNQSVGQQPEREDAPDENGHHTYYRGIHLSGKGAEGVDWDDDDSVLNHLSARNTRYTSKFQRGHPKATPFGSCWTTGKNLAHKFAVNTFSNMGRRQAPVDRSKPHFGAVLEAKTTQPCEEESHLKGYNEQERKVETNKVASLTLHLHRLDPEHSRGATPEQTHVRSIEVPASRYQPTNDEKIAYHKESASFYKNDSPNPEQHEFHKAEVQRLKAEGSQGHQGWLPHLDADVESMIATARVHYPAEGPDGEDADGIMIALVPPKRVIDRLPLPEDGEHPSNVHITLVYLGNVSEFTKAQVEYLPELIESWAETQRPLKATVQGVGTFSNPGSHVLWAAADIPGGNHMWVSLADTLRSHGYAFKENHGWTPHITMSYEKHHVRFLPKVERMEFGVREVWCCIGGRWESFRLTGK